MKINNSKENHIKIEEFGYEKEEEIGVTRAKGNMVNWWVYQT